MSKTLTIYLAADIRKLTGGLNSAQAQMNGFQRGMSNLSNTMTSMLGPALIGAGVAAGALAVSLGIDGVKAAIEDEAAAAKLAKTMDNLALSQDTSAAEASIDAMQRQYGVSDSLLRPSFEKLVRATGDTSEALRLLTLAQDVAAGTGRNLDSVTQALTRAAGGSATALARIAPELDRNILKSGDLDAITRELASTFGGQAQTAADTYQGQLNRLSVGFDELKESFGTGFLNALSNAEGKTEDLMGSMKKLEPIMARLGEKAYETAEGFAQAAIDAVSIIDAINDGDWRMAWQVFAWGEDSVAGYVTELRNAAAATYGLNKAWATMGGGEFADDISATAAETSRWNAVARENDAVIRTNGGTLDEWRDSLKASAAETYSTGTATDLLTESYAKQQQQLGETTSKLDAYVKTLEEKSSQIATYSAGIATSILGGIDLGQAMRTGEELGTTTLAAFDEQIAQAKWFGNVLGAIKASGADQRLTDELASLGPEVGGKLGQEMLDKGLIQTFSDKLVDVTNAARTMGDAMVPEFMLAGEAQAKSNVEGMIKQFDAESDRLKKLGKAIGKPIGSNIKAEILKAAAEALETAEANQRASEARRAATTASQQAANSTQQLAQLVSQAIATSNSRTGYSMGVPIPSPVLS